MEITASELLDKIMRNGIYSHILKDQYFYCLTKTDKKQISELITHCDDILCFAGSGDKHLLCKHKSGMWQVEEITIIPSL